MSVSWVLIRFRGRLSQSNESLIPSIDSALHSGMEGAFDVVKDIGSRLGRSQVTAVSEALAFDHAEEAFHTKRVNASRWSTVQDSDRRVAR